MENEYANVHRGLHYLANAATEAFEGAREKVRAFLNAGIDRRDHLHALGDRGDQSRRARASGSDNIGAGDEIVLSIMEHHSNIVPWHFTARAQGRRHQMGAASTMTASSTSTGFEKLLTARTKIVAITHMSNVLGTVTPMKEIVRIAHARGIPVLVDGAQGAVHLDVDVRDLDADFYVFTGHKVYGPTGIGVLYGKREWLERMPPYQGGGEMIDEVTTDTITYNEPPHRFEAGTPPIVQAIGLGAALDYMDGLGRDAIAAHEEALRDYAHERLARMNSMRIIGEAPGKGAIVSFEMKGAHAHDVATVIDRSGVAVRAGTHCAMPLLEALRRDLDVPRFLRPLQHASTKSMCWPRPCARPKRFLLEEPPCMDAPLTEQTPATDAAEPAGVLGQGDLAREEVERLTDDIVGGAEDRL